MAAPRHLLLLLACLAACQGFEGEARQQLGEQGRGRGVMEPQQQQLEGTGRPGRRVLFDLRAVREMETLRMLEEHQLAVGDGKSKPLFSHRSVFSPRVDAPLFGGSVGSPTILKERELRRQQIEAEAQRKAAAANAAAGAGEGGAGRGGTAPGAQQQQQQADRVHPPQVRLAGQDSDEAAQQAARAQAAQQTAEAEQAQEVAQLRQRQWEAIEQEQPPTRTAPGAAGGQGQQQQPGQQPVVQTAPAATPLSLLLDSAPGEDELEPVPEPELQFKDEGGLHILIWLPQDTLPRDLLVGKKPQVWLYTLLRADYDAARLLPHFIDHYIKLGFHPANMLFVVSHDPAAADSRGMHATTALLDSYGLDYRMWRGRYSEEAALKHKLQVLSRVPIRDWVVTADVDELHEYGGHSAAQFFAQRDFEGTNWVRGLLVDRVAAGGALSAVEAAPSLFKQFPLKCDVSRRVAQVSGTRVAAFKAYLRSGLGDDGAMGITDARAYFGAAAPGEESPRHSLCGGEDLLPLTPYARYWQFYRAPDVQGNVYLWDAREAEPLVKIHHFRWRAGLDRSVADQLQQQQAEAEGCGSGVTAAPAAWQEAQRVADTILAKGAIDVGNAYLKCHLAEEPRLPRSGRRAGRPGMAAGIGQQPQQRAAASAGASGADHSEQ